MARLFFNIWPLTPTKLFPKALKIAQVGTIISQYKIKVFKNYQRLLKFGQSGKFLPNLVTLLPSDIKRFKLEKKIITLVPAARQYLTHYSSFQVCQQMRMSLISSFQLIANWILPLGI